MGFILLCTYDWVCLNLDGIQNLKIEDKMENIKRKRIGITGLFPFLGPTPPRPCGLLPCPTVAQSTHA
jgi:hypothetical protein